MLQTQIHPSSGSLAQVGSPDRRVRQGSWAKGKRSLSPFVIIFCGDGGEEGILNPSPFPI